ncbi:MAG: hypothetical protein ACK4UN_18380, partial [Limisphaerales bacterium]
MRFPIIAAALLLGVFSAQASHVKQRCYKPTAPVVYGQPVVYQAPVVYTPPVAYTAPVYHQGAAPVVYSPAYTSPVVISGYGYRPLPNVIIIGSGHARHGMLPRRCR